MSTLLAIFGLCLLMLTGTITKANYFKRETPRAARYANVQINTYRSFMLATSYYVAAHPTYNGSITWAMLSSASTTPDAFKSVSFSSEWKAVTDGAGKFILCAPMDEAAVGAVSQLLAKATAPTKVTISGVDYLWYGDSTIASANAAKCG